MKDADQVVNAGTVVRSPQGSVWFLPSQDSAGLVRRLHATAGKCGARISCQKWYAFCPKSPDSVQPLLRVEILEQGDARTKKGGEQKSVA